MRGAVVAHRLKTLDIRYLAPGARRLALKLFSLEVPHRIPKNLPDFKILSRVSSTPICPAEGDPVIEAADRFLLGGLQLLGRDMQPWIDSWSADPATGFKWPASGKTSPPPGSDPKAPWEISRFYFAPWLAGASVMSGDRRYLTALLDFVEDWKAENPLGRGINWRVPMEAGIRAANLSVALAVLSRDQEMLKGASGVIGPLLNEHGAFVSKNLEAGPGPPTNHLLVGAAGLALTGATMSNGSWLRRSRRILEREAVRQVPQDGAHVEASPSYHRFCMEALACASWAFRAIGAQDSAIDEAVARMSRFVSAYTRPDGSAPELGDADDGRFIVATGMLAHERSHHAYLAWLLPPGTDHPQFGQSQAQTFSGYAFLRNGEEWASFRCGGFGKYGGHAHADQLHATWSLGGANVLLDAGTGSYKGDPDLRNHLRSAEMHNAPLVDSREPNRWTRDDIFYMSDNTKGELTLVDENTAIGSHHGYPGIAVSRQAQLGNGLTLTDKIGGAGEHHISWRFLVDGDWETTGRSSARGTKDGNEFEFSWPKEIEGSLTEVTRSPAYGEVRAIQALDLKWHGRIPVEFSFRIGPS